ASPGARRRPAPSSARSPISAQGPEWKVLGIQVVLEIEDARKAGAVPQGIGPRPLLALRVEKVLDAALHRGPLGAPGGEEPQQRPRGLARDGLAAARPRRVLVGSQRLAPAAVGVLPRFQPGHRAAHVLLRAVLADGADAAEHRPGAVDVVGAPAPVPRPVRVLVASQIPERAPGGGMV